MGHLHKILGKLTGMKRMIKKDYPQLTEAQLLEIDDLIGVCASRIINVIVKNE